MHIHTLITIIAILTHKMTTTTTVNEALSKMIYTH